METYKSILKKIGPYIGQVEPILLNLSQFRTDLGGAQGGGRVARASGQGGDGRQGSDRRGGRGGKSGAGPTTGDGGVLARGCPNGGC